MIPRISHRSISTKVLSPELLIQLRQNAQDRPRRILYGLEKIPVSSKRNSSTRITTSTDVNAYP